MEGCHCLGTRDWYLMHYSNPVATGGQKHTHTHTLIESGGLSVNPQPFLCKLTIKKLKKTEVGLTKYNYWLQYLPDGGV
jgi:hypothetical protein